MTLIISILIAILVKGPNEESEDSEDGIVITFLSGSIISPLWETFVFQYLIINLMMNLISNIDLSIFISLCVSSTAFSIAHIIGRNSRHALTRIPSGLALSFVYILSKVSGLYSPFWITFVFHAVWNTIVLIPIALSDNRKRTKKETSS